MWEPSRGYPTRNSLNAFSTATAKPRNSHSPPWSSGTARWCFASVGGSCTTRTTPTTPSKPHFSCSFAGHRRSAIDNRSRAGFTGSRFVSRHPPGRPRFSERSANVAPFAMKRPRTTTLTNPTRRPSRFTTKSNAFPNDFANRSFSATCKKSATNKPPRNSAAPWERSKAGSLGSRPRRDGGNRPRE